MKIVCAPASFKECLTAREVAAAMAAGVRKVDSRIECIECPIGDGGEGTMDAMVSAAAGEFRTLTVNDPLGQPIHARLGVIDGGRCAIVELAEASGLTLVPKDQRDPTRTTTFGTGQLIAHAAGLGCKQIIVCIGGSATVDGGTGIAQALGWRFLDHQGIEFTRPLMCGGMLKQIAQIIPPVEQQLPRIRVACDVTNPLCGPNGAAAVYGPQKGATPAQVEALDEGLLHFAELVGGDREQPGAGAAGGAGFGLAQFCGATLERGIDLVLDAVKFDDHLQGASLVLTGEGRLDEQSLQGKACMGVAKRAAEFGLTTVAIVGSAGSGLDQFRERLQNGGLSRHISLTDRFGNARALAEAGSLIAQVAGEIVSKQHRQTDG